jgi:hypothetical protein
MKIKIDEKEILKHLKKNIVYLVEKTNKIVENKNNPINNNEDYSAIVDPVVKYMMEKEGIPKDGFLDFKDMVSVSVISREAKGILLKYNGKLSDQEITEMAYNCAIDYLSDFDLETKDFTYKVFLEHRNAYKKIDQAISNGKWPEVIAISDKLTGKQ